MNNYSKMCSSSQPKTRVNSVQRRQLTCIRSALTHKQCHVLNRTGKLTVRAVNSISVLPTTEPNDGHGRHRVLKAAVAFLSNDSVTVFFQILETTQSLTHCLSTTPPDTALVTIIFYSCRHIFEYRRASNQQLT